MSDVAHLRGPAAVAKAAEDEHVTEYAPNGDPVLSPSQVATYLMCPRKWAARYLHGQREPVAEGTHAGKRMHSLLEAYYQKGLVPSQETPEGIWAQTLMKDGDLPISGEPERKFKFEHEGVWWRGSVDLIYRRDGLYVIRDHKTTSDVDGFWTHKDASDPQAIIYAFQAYLTDDPEEVEFEWGYVSRDRRYPKTRVERVRMTWDITAAGMVKLTAAGREMLRLYRERPKLNNLPPTGTETGGCEAFNGCKVQGCNVTALDRIKGLQLFNARKKGEQDMSYLDQIRARAAQQKALTGGGEPEAPPSPEEPPTAPDIRTRLAQAKDAVAPEPYTPPATTEAPKPVTAPTPRRGRQRKAEVAPARPSVNEPAPAPETYEPPPPAGGIREETAEEAFYSRPEPPRHRFEDLTPKADGMILCVNCAPLDAPAVLFTRWAEPIHAALKEAKGWDTYQIAQFEGKAAFQDALKQFMLQAPPVGYLVVDARTDEGRDALPTLERFAAGIIRGF